MLYANINLFKQENVFYFFSAYLGAKVFDYDQGGISKCHIRREDFEICGIIKFSLVKLALKVLQQSDPEDVRESQR